MENKNNVVVILLVVLIGVVSGIGLLIGINNAVKVSISPMYTKLAEIESIVKIIDSKLSGGQAGNGSGELANALAAIQKDIAQLKGNNAQPLQQQPPQEDMNKVYALDPGATPIIGPHDAPITITEFSDFQCPFCARFYPVAKEVLGAYPTQVRLIVKNFPLPFHPNARPAAKLALAANEQGKFQGMMESLLTNGGDVSEAKVKEYAKSLGLDYNKLMADYKNKDAQWEKQITDDMQLGGNADVRGTPTFYLNGKKTNSRDLAAFKAEIDPILKAGK